MAVMCPCRAAHTDAWPPGAGVAGIPCASWYNTNPPRFFFAQSILPSVVAMDPCQKYAASEPCGHAVPAKNGRQHGIDTRSSDHGNIGRVAGSCSLVERQIAEVGKGAGRTTGSMLCCFSSLRLCTQVGPCRFLFWPAAFVLQCAQRHHPQRRRRRGPAAQHRNPKT